MKKAEFIQHWEAIEPGQPINIGAIPYKHTGSTFDEDGIRALGSAEFIDQVLSRIKDLLQYENGSTRLAISYSQATDKNTGDLLDSYKAYIQVHQRGPHAR